MIREIEEFMKAMRWNGFRGSFRFFSFGSRQFFFGFGWKK